MPLTFLQQTVKQIEVIREVVLSEVSELNEVMNKEQGSEDDHQ